MELFGVEETVVKSRDSNCSDHHLRKVSSLSTIANDADYFTDKEINVEDSGDGGCVKCIG